MEKKGLKRNKRSVSEEETKFTMYIYIYIYVKRERERRGYIFCCEFIFIEFFFFATYVGSLYSDIAEFCRFTDFFLFRFFENNFIIF